MKRKHQKTLEAIFSAKARSDIKWNDVVSLLENCGAYIEERKGSRVAVDLNGVILILHRPHPGKEVDKGALTSIKRFLTEAGVKP